MSRRAAQSRRQARRDARQQVTAAVVETPSVDPAEAVTDSILWAEIYGLVTIDADGRTIRVIDDRVAGFLTDEASR